LANRGRPLYERANSYYFLAAALGGVGVFPYLIGSSEVAAHHDIWANGWIRAAAVFWALAVAALIIGIVIQVFHAQRIMRGNRTKRQREAQRQMRKAEEAVLLEMVKMKQAQRREESDAHWWGRAEPRPGSAGGLNVQLHSPRTASVPDDAVAICVVTRSGDLYRRSSSEDVCHSTGTGGLSS